MHLPQCVTVMSVIESMHTTHCTFDNVKGSSGSCCSCALTAAACCSSSTFDSPLSSSTSLKSTSSISGSSSFKHRLPVRFRLAVFGGGEGDPSDDWSSALRFRMAAGIAGGDGSAVRSINSPKLSVLVKRSSNIWSTEEPQEFERESERLAGAAS